MADSRGPSGRPHISSETPGPILAVICICCAVLSVLVAGATILHQIRYRRKERSTHFDIQWDIWLGCALAVSVAQSAVTFRQVGSGLGYPIDSLSSSQLVTFSKLEYANQLLYLGSLTLLKAIHFIQQRAATYPETSPYIPAAIAAGMIAFFFAGAFPCHLPDTWQLRISSCYDQTAFWACFGVFDILTDLYFMVIVFLATMKLQMNRYDKIKLYLVISMRALPAAAAIVRLPLINPAYTSRNYTITSYALAIPTQLQLHLAVVALSMGRIFKFLKTLNTGYFDAAIRKPGSGTTRGSGKVLSKRSDHATDTNPSETESNRDLTSPSRESDRERDDFVPGEHGIAKGFVELDGGVRPESDETTREELKPLDLNAHISTRYTVERRSDGRPARSPGINV